MFIETERLKIFALPPTQLKLWINDTSELEKELNVSEQTGFMEGIFKEIVQNQLQITMADEENYIWHTFWLIIRKSDNVVVGSFDFKDVPSVNGEVEIGYGTGKKFENNGYMVETVKAMCDWAKTDELVKRIIAETDIDGIVSQHILKKCGFSEYFRDETIWWELVKG